jgi:peroxiredoxin
VVPLAATVVVALVGGLTAWVVASSDHHPARHTSGSRCSVRVSGTHEQVAVGSRVPDFTLPTLDGRCAHLADYRGRPVIVNFWASWCNPCRREFPLFRAALDRHRHDRLAVLGVTHNDIVDDSRQFAREEGATWPLLVDDGNDVGNAFGVNALPKTFFIRPDGTLVARIYGLTSRKDLEAEIARILGP